MIKRIRFGLASCVTLALFSGIVARLFYLQVYKHDELMRKSQRQTALALFDAPARGDILDRDGRALALSIEGGSCFADPSRIQNPDKVAQSLSPLLHIPVEKLKEKLSSKRRFVWLARRLDPSVTRQVSSLRLTGVRILPEKKRFYPQETLACHLLGVVSQEDEGLAGVELVANDWLKGIKAPFLFRQWPFASGKPSLPYASADVSPHSVVLTIDRTLQMIVEQELAAQMVESKAARGIVIVQNPQTGEILAMASAPTFDCNLWGTEFMTDDHNPEMLKNPAVEKVVEPGSTFKVVTAAAAIEENVMDPSGMVFCEYGSWRHYDRVIHDHEKEGWLRFADVLSFSSNIGTAKVALMVGAQNLYEYARAFGFGMPTGCGLPGDGVGILRSPKQWRATSTASISFGQEVGVTPLQMVNAYSAIANGGYLREPRLFRGMVDEDGQYHQWQIPDPIRHVVSDRTAKRLRQMLRGVVEYGTGKAARVQGIPVAGKTGTAQKIDPKTRLYSSEHYLASFCGFAPADNPKVVVGVFLDDPKKTYWGGLEAAPLFSRIMKNIAGYVGIETAVGPLVQSYPVPRS